MTKGVRKSAAAHVKQEDDMVLPFARGADGEYGLSKDAIDVYRILNNHRKECEQSGDYDAARLTRLRLTRMRQTQLMKQRRGMESRHQTARDQLLSIQTDEVNDFRRLWEEKENPALESMVQKLEEDLRERQEVEFIQFQSELSAQVYKPPKYSAEVLDLKRRMVVLRSQGEYEGAKKFQLRINQLVAGEQDKNKKSLKEKFDRTCEVFKMKQSKELHVLMTRIAHSRHQKETEYIRQKMLLEKKHRKDLAVLDAAQGIERAKVQALPKLGCVTPRASPFTVR